MGKQWRQWETLFFGAPKSLQMVTAVVTLKDTCSLEEKLWATYKKQRLYFANKSLSSQSYGFSSSHVWMWELDYKKSWVPKNWCLQTVVLAGSCLDSKEIQSVNPKGNQSWIFIGRNWCWSWNSNSWPPDVKNWLIWKDPNAGKDWRQEEKGTTGDEMVGWHHRFDGHEFEQALGIGDGQGSLACCSPWGRKESDTTEWLNWTEILPELEIYIIKSWWSILV